MRDSGLNIHIETVDLSPLTESFYTCRFCGEVVAGYNWHYCNPKYNYREVFDRLQNIEALLKRIAEKLGT